MGEVWEKWEPCEGLAEKYCVEAIYDDLDGFRILLSDSKDEESRIVLFFGDAVNAHRSVNESYQSGTD